MAEPDNPARVEATLEGEALAVALAGEWSIMGGRPSWTTALAGRQPRRVVLRDGGLDQWDSSLLLFVFEVQQWCRIAGAHCDTKALPDRIQALLGQMSASHETSVPFDRSENFLSAVGVW
jgi:phospholipid/cholesterol/gamma-HCH transport system permease protein